MAFSRSRPGHRPRKREGGAGLEVSPVYEGIGVRLLLSREILLLFKEFHYETGLFTPLFLQATRYKIKQRVALVD